MFRPNLRIALPLLALLLLAACGKDQADDASMPAVANNDPASAVMSQVSLLNAGKIDALVKASLPADDYQAVRQKFAEEQKKDLSITDEQRKEFADNMKRLSAPDAEETLFKQAQPMLAQYDSKYKAMLPMYVGMGQTMMTTAINQSKDMTPEQKKQASELLSAAASWVQDTNWGDEAKAKQAIAVVTSTARKLDLKTLDQARAMDYDQAMLKYSQMWTGTRKLLAVYGMNIDKALDSVKAKTISHKDGTATVEVDYTLFDKPMQTNVEMVERDGRWYNADMLSKLEKSLVQDKAAAASTAPAPVAVPGNGGSVD